MSRFPTAAQRAAWAGVATGNHESAGQRRSGKTRKGHPALRAALTQAAQAAAHTQNTYLSAQYHPIAARRGQKRAVTAVAHSIVMIGYHLIHWKEEYRELGGDSFEQRRPEATAQRLLKRLEKLGYQVAVQPSPAAQPASSYFRARLLEDPTRRSVFWTGKSFLVVGIGFFSSPQGSPYAQGPLFERRKKRFHLEPTEVAGALTTCYSPVQRGASFGIYPVGGGCGIYVDVGLGVYVGGGGDVGVPVTVRVGVNGGGNVGGGGGVLVADGIGVLGGGQVLVGVGGGGVAGGMSVDGGGVGGSQGNCSDLFHITALRPTRASHCASFSHLMAQVYGWQCIAPHFESSLPQV